MSGETYDPSLEFPGFEEDVTEEPPTDVQRNPFHIVVLKSPVLSTKRRIASISSYPEVSIGRDKPPDASSPRLRLKEMAVSKYHAITYWDAERQAWGLVDVGSVHGTFIQSKDRNGHEERLSPSKIASHPRYLRHLDIIRIGGTTLACHIHPPEELSCDECNLTPSNAMHLVASGSSTGASTPVLTDSTDTASTSFQPQKDVRTSLAGLKRHLLSRHPHSDSSAGTYKDRAAARREQLGTSQPPPPMAPPAPLVPAPAARLRPQRSLQAQSTTADVEEVASPAEPIPVSNIGHRLLAKQGWTPGSGLGVDQSGRSEPIVAKSSINRAGLGTSNPSSS